MINKLIKLVAYFNNKGLVKEADYLKAVIKKASYGDRMIEERNYMNDRRTRAKDAWDGFDQATNTITISWTDYDEEDYEVEKELKLPARFELCDLCEGKGKVVNPSIDAGGLSRDDFDEDPGFEEDYHSGRFDIHCPQCQGKRVIPAVDYERLSGEEKKEFDQYVHDQEEAARDAEADRRTMMAEMGYGW
jgi:hypothetical protein